MGPTLCTVPEGPRCVIEGCAVNEPATGILLAESGLPLVALRSLAAQRSIGEEREHLETVRFHHRKAQKVRSPSLALRARFMSAQLLVARCVTECRP